MAVQLERGCVGLVTGAVMWRRGIHWSPPLWKDRQEPVCLRHTVSYCLVKRTNRHFCENYKKVPPPSTLGQRQPHDCRLGKRNAGGISAPTHSHSTHKPTWRPQVTSLPGTRRRRGWAKRHSYNRYLSCWVCYLTTSRCSRKHHLNREAFPEHPLYVSNLVFNSFILLPCAHHLPSHTIYVIYTYMYYVCVLYSSLAHHLPSSRIKDPWGQGLSSVLPTVLSLVPRTVPGTQEVLNICWVKYY